jgi:hypothetical protein
MIWLLFCFGILIFCLVKPNAARIGIGFFFLAMSLGVNLMTLLGDPQSYITMGSQSLIPLSRWVFQTIIALNPLLFILLLMGYEIAVGVLLLSKQRAVKFGLIGGILFLIGITPLSVETLANPVMAVALAYLLTKEFDRSFLDIVRAKLRPSVRRVGGPRGDVPPSGI